MLPTSLSLYKERFLSSSTTKTRASNLLNSSALLWFQIPLMWSSVSLLLMRLIFRLAWSGSSAVPPNQVTGWQLLVGLAVIPHAINTVKWFGKAARLLPFFQYRQINLTVCVLQGVWSAWQEANMLVPVKPSATRRILRVNVSWWRRKACGSCLGSNFWTAVWQTCNWILWPTMLRSVTSTGPFICTRNPQIKPLYWVNKDLKRLCNEKRENLLFTIFTAFRNKDGASVCVARCHYQWCVSLCCLCHC